MMPSDDPGNGSQIPPSRTVEIVNHSVASDELLKATREITIRHGEDIYRLRLTAQNKLILTK